MSFELTKKEFINYWVIHNAIYGAKKKKRKFSKATIAKITTVQTALSALKNNKYSDYTKRLAVKKIILISLSEKVNFLQIPNFATLVPLMRLERDDYSVFDSVIFRDAIEYLISKDGISCSLANIDNILNKGSLYWKDPSRRNGGAFRYNFYDLLINLKSNDGARILVANENIATNSSNITNFEIINDCVNIPQDKDARFILISDDRSNNTFLRSIGVNLSKGIDMIVYDGKMSEVKIFEAKSINESGGGQNLQYGNMKSVSLIKKIAKRGDKELAVNGYGLFSGSLPFCSGEEISYLLDNDEYRIITKLRLLTNFNNIIEAQPAVDSSDKQ